LVAPGLVAPGLVAPALVGVPKKVFKNRNPQASIARILFYHTVQPKLSNFYTHKRREKFIDMESFITKSAHMHHLFTKIE
jgi:hypothetical protein